MNPSRSSLLLVLVLFLLAPAPPAAGQEVDGGAAGDTATVVIRVRRMPEGHSPRGALWRAAVAPGWGQIYNRQYYKLPIVYAGLAGIAATALYTNHTYLLYRHAYLYAEPRLWEDGEPAFPEYYDDYVKVLDANEVAYTDPTAADVRSRVSATFKQRRDILRRNRDLLYIGVGLFYGLTIVDAYVGAHLLDFDVSEDLSVTVLPVPNGVGAVLRANR